MKVLAVFVAAIVATCAAQKFEYEQRIYQVFDGEGEVCATYTLAAQFTVTYETNNTADGSMNAIINLPPVPRNGSDDSLAMSECPDNSTGRSTSVLRVSFSDGEVFTIVVGEANGTSLQNEPANWEVTEIGFQYNLEDGLYFPNSTKMGVFTAALSDPATINIAASSGMLFQCNTQLALELPVDGASAVEFKHMDLLLNPYNTTTGNTFPCAADATSSNKTVPIAVGVSLGALLILVVIAYLIGRRMRKGAGYQKV